MKIIVPLDSIEVDTKHPQWNTTFTADMSTGERVQRLTYGSQTETRTRHQPHTVKTQTAYRGINYMGVNFSHPNGPQVEIVTSGKVLENPADLINIDSVSELWGNINATGLLYGYAPQVLPQTQLCAADITRDIITEFNPDEYTDLIRRYYTGKDFVQARDYAPNIQLQRNVKGKDRQRTLTGYNKYREANGEYFNPNTLRWELRINSFEMLRKYLQQPPGPIMLMPALASPANPISAVFDEVLKGIQLTPAMKSMNTIPIDTPMPTETRAALFAAQELTFDEKAYFARLRELSFNLAPLEAELKGDKNAARKMKPYREVFTRWQGFTANTGHDITLLTEMVDKIRTPQLNHSINHMLNQYAQTA